MHYHFTTIDSTNTWAKQNASLLARDQVTLVTADTQTAGRGRFKRKWESPPHQNVYASFCFFINKEQHPCLGNIPQVLAISVVQVLEALGFQSRLKWPNDIQISNKKVAGILCETTSVSEQLCVIVGIGLNVNMSLELLQKIDRPATSLLVEGGAIHDLQKVIALLQYYFMPNLKCLLSDGFQPFLNTYRTLVSTDQKIRFHDNLNIWEGFFHSIDEDGSLNLQLISGEIKHFIAGEILP
jgi:BirA family biotin operon repressor/biotin-[acetyl-CoA-carboxylase] ligase